MKFNIYIKTVKIYIKDTKNFLNKLKYFGILPGNVIICAVNIVGLYPNIPNEGLPFLRKHLDLRMEKLTSTHPVVELAKIVLESTFNSNKKNHTSRKEALQ